MNALPNDGWIPLGRLLVEEGLISEEQLAEALSEQQESRELLGQILVERGAVATADLAAALAEQFGLGRAAEIQRAPPSL